MEKDKPFLDPDLTLEKLAEEFNMSTRKLSNVLNTEYHYSNMGKTLNIRLFNDIMPN